MSDKDYIKELFQNQLGGHEVKVDPQLWQGVQAQLGNAASTGAASSAAVAGKTSLFVKMGIAAAVASAAIATAYVLVTSTEAPTENSEVPSKEIASESLNALHIDLSNKSDSMEKSGSPLEVSNNVVRPSVELDPIVSQSEGTVPNLSFVPDAVPNELPPNSKVDKSGGTASPHPTQPTVVDPLPSLGLTVGFDKLSNQHYLFNAESEFADRIFWDFGDGFTSTTDKVEHIFNESGTFTVTAYAYRNDEIQQKQLSITIDVAGKITNLPTIFTPNNDGSNDEFFIESEGLLDFSIVVMNDKGEILYESDNPDFRWDGRDRKTGLIADDGMYFYIITAKDELGNTISKHQRLQLKK